MIVKHRDRELLRFKWLEPEGIQIISVNAAERKFLPLEFSGANDERMLERRLEAWLKNRTAPMGRHFIRNLMTSLGLDPQEPDFHRKALDFSKGLSLNDVYWVTPEDFTGSWRDCNLYDNEFSKTMSEIAFSGSGEIGDEAITTSPEMTTNGMLPKCWRRKNGQILLYKGSIANGDEPYAEYYAAQVATAMGLAHVDYDLAMYKGRLCSTCPLFTSDKIGYVPASRLPNRRAMLSDVRFSPMFLFDALVFNTDRHFGNFGYLVDNDKNKICGVAPIFDNGYAMFEPRYGKHPALFDTWLGDFAEIALPRDVLNSLKGFRFRRHAHYNWPTEKLGEIERFLQKRIDDIIKYGSNADKYLQIPTNDVGVKNKISSENVGVNLQDLDPVDLQILWNMKANRFVTGKELAAVLGREERTIERHIKSLREANIVNRHGADKNGYWDVLAEW